MGWCRAGRWTGPGRTAAPGRAPYGTQIASALAHAHARGSHRDLKSANVVITPEGQAKVLDFGLAKPLAGEVPAGTETVTRRRGT